MTITREQLELAAKAAGVEQSIVQFGPYPQQVWSRSKGRYVQSWNPHDDHGQLLDLAMACDISIMHDDIGYTAGTGLRQFKRYTHGDFNSLAEAVILAASEQQLAKEKKE